MTSTGRALAVVAVALFAGAAPASGQETEELRLTVQDAIRLALERNLDLKIERYEPLVARERTRQSTADFDPVLQLSAVWNRTELPVFSALDQQASTGQIVEDGLRPDSSIFGKLITGTQYGVSLSTPYIQTTNPNRLYDDYYRPVLAFSLVQPLLKDFGPDVNLVRLRQAERGEVMAALGVEARMLAVMQEVEAGYWQLVFTQGHLRVAEGGLDLAFDLAARLRRLEAVGRATRLDVLQAEVAVAARRGDLERAIADQQNAQVLLQVRMNPNPAPRRRLVATSAPPEDGVPVDLDGKVARALARRPEVRRQELVIENLQLEEIAARNGLLPRLDVVGSLGWTGVSGTGVGPNIRGPLPPRLRGDTFFDSFQGFFTPNGNTSWSLGLRLQMPLGNHDALARLEQTRLRTDQERVRLTLLKNQVSADVQTAFQDMTATWVQLLAAEEQVALAREQLAAMERQFAAGLATVRTLLEVQDQLARAEDVRVRAAADYSIARARLAAASATSFDIYRLVVPR